MECYVNLREKGTAINIHLTETWWRHYQVSFLTTRITYLRFPPNIFSDPPYLLWLHIHLHSLGGKGTLNILRTGSLSIPPPFSPRPLHSPPSRPRSDPSSRSLVTGWLWEKSRVSLKNTIQYKHSDQGRDPTFVPRSARYPISHNTSLSILLHGLQIWKESKGFPADPHWDKQ